MPASREMPKYRCHKQVHALQIAAIEINDAGHAVMAFKDAGYGPIVIEENYRERFKGTEDDLGYYVVYEDGYKSWSPSKAFEEGYTRIA